MWLPHDDDAIYLFMYFIPSSVCMRFHNIKTNNSFQFVLFISSVCTWLRFAFIFLIVVHFALTTRSLFRVNGHLLVCFPLLLLSQDGYGNHE